MSPRAPAHVARVLQRLAELGHPASARHDDLIHWDGTCPVCDGALVVGDHLWQDSGPRVVLTCLRDEEPVVLAKLGLRHGELFLRRPKPPRRANAAAVNHLVQVLTDRLCPPLIAEPPGGQGRRLWRFWCPVCDGGRYDRSLLPYRPLVVASDGALWCDAQIGVHGPVTCNFTPDKLAHDLETL